jgi:hypothetical protein
MTLFARLSWIDSFYKDDDSERTNDRSTRSKESLRNRKGAAIEWTQARRKAGLDARTDSANLALSQGKPG